ncbi:MAG TPA: hypothetical protein DCO65_09000 [Spartobacteria bacterium]|nr:hypothetical protein [Spartobacteria bacterium]
MQTLRIKIEPREMVVAKQVLLERYPRRKIPGGIRHIRGVESSVPKESALLVIRHEKGIAGEVNRLGSRKGKHLRPGLAAHETYVSELRIGNAGGGRPQIKRALIALVKVLLRLDAHILRDRAGAGNKDGKNKESR